MLAYNTVLWLSYFVSWMLLIDLNKKGWKLLTHYPPGDSQDYQSFDFIEDPMKRLWSRIELNPASGRPLPWLSHVVPQWYLIENEWIKNECIMHDKIDLHGQIWATLNTIKIFFFPEILSNHLNAKTYRAQRLNCSDHGARDRSQDHVIFTSLCYMTIF